MRDERPGTIKRQLDELLRLAVNVQKNLELSGYAAYADRLRWVVDEVSRVRDYVERSRPEDGGSTQGNKL